jgi:hypothetical protein
MELLLASYNLLRTVNFPTSIENGFVTTIDNIFVDASLQGTYIIYPLFNVLSDHDAQLIVLTEVKAFIKNGSGREKKIIRKIDQTIAQDFKYKSSFETWDSVFGSNDMNMMSNSFLNSFL